jgi:hypothetical protein
MKKGIFLAILLGAMVSCTSTQYAVKQREPAQPGALANQHVYRIHVTYLHEDEAGLVNTIDEIQAVVRTADTGDAAYYKWESYQIRAYKIGSSSEARMESQPSSDAAWKDYKPAVGFDYVMKGLASTEQGDLSNLPSMDSIPRDMDGFLFYTSVIDFHSWAIYCDTFLADSGNGRPRLEKIGDTYTMEMPKSPIPLLDWQGLTSDFKFEGGYSVAAYLADVDVNGTPARLLSLDQNQRMKQTVHGKVGTVELNMPYEGTSRVLGHMYWSPDNELLKASFYEYVYSVVYAPVMIKVIVHEKRMYDIERVE